MDQSIHNRQMKKIIASMSKHECKEHCYHVYRGSFMRVLPDGHVLQKCCSCCSTRTIHRDHIVYGNDCVKVEISW
jgi:hypothetical protein